MKKYGYIDSAYSLLSKLGSGLLGTVYKAKRLTNNDIVAIKIFHKNVAEDMNNKKEFWKQAENYLMLNHPNITKVIEYFEEENIPHIIMEYLNGSNLMLYLKSKVRLSEFEACIFAKQIIYALIEANRKNLIHLDLKPQNIIVLENAKIKVSDFGLAKLIENTSSLRNLLTPQYMSPEQAKGSKNTDFRSDIYSLGIILFEMLSGNVPFDGNSFTSIGIKHIMEPVPITNLEALGISSQMKDIIKRSLAKNPELRYKTLEEMLSDIDYCIKKPENINMNSLQINDFFKSPQNDDLMVSSKENLNEIEEKQRDKWYQQKSNALQIIANAESHIIESRAQQADIYASSILYEAEALIQEAYRLISINEFNESITKAKSAILKATIATQKAHEAKAKMILKDAKKSMEILSLKYQEFVSAFQDENINNTYQSLTQRLTIAEHYLNKGNFTNVQNELQNFNEAMADFEKNITQKKTEYLKKKASNIIQKADNLISELERLNISDTSNSTIANLKTSLREAKILFDNYDFEESLQKAEFAASSATIAYQKALETQAKILLSDAKKSMEALKLKYQEFVSTFQDDSLNNNYQSLIQQFSSIEHYLDKGDFSNVQNELQNFNESISDLEKNINQKKAEHIKKKALNTIQKADNLIAELEQLNTNDTFNSTISNLKSSLREAKILCDNNEFDESIQKAEFVASSVSIALKEASLCQDKENSKSKVINHIQTYEDYNILLTEIDN